MTDTTWAPPRIFLQREMGEQGSHTWCEDSINECEQVEYVRVDADIAEMRAVIDLVAVKVGGLFACMGHGMKVSGTMIEEAQAAADAAFDLSAKLADKESS